MHRCQWCGCSTKYQLCKECEQKFIDHIVDYNYPYRLGDKLYTMVCVDHRSKFEIRETILTGYCGILIRDVENIIKADPDNKYDFKKNDKYNWCWKYVYNLKSNNTYLNRSPDEVFLTKDKCFNVNKERVNKLTKKQITNMLYNEIHDKIADTLEDLEPDELEQFIQQQVNNFDIKKELVRKIDADLVEKYEQQEKQRAEELEELGIADAELTGQQILIVDVVRNFLKSDLARRFNVGGLTVYIQDGYVNAMWDFKERYSNDLENED